MITLKFCLQRPSSEQRLILVFQDQMAALNRQILFQKIKVKQQVSPQAAERTLAAQQAAKLKHDKFIEAFHGRLAGIKRGVDELNGRLDVMEKRK